MINPQRQPVYAPAKQQQGVVILEAMIAILIFSMGILAVVGMQAAMIKNTSDAKYRSEASFIAQQTIGQMWADPNNLNSFIIADEDISAQIPLGKRTIDVQNATQVIVTIKWTQPGQTEHNFTTTARIAGG